MVCLTPWYTAWCYWARLVPGGSPREGHVPPGGQLTPHRLQQASMVGSCHRLIRCALILSNGHVALTRGRPVPPSGLTGPCRGKTRHAFCLKTFAQPLTWLVQSRRAGGNAFLPQSQGTLSCLIPAAAVACQDCASVLPPAGDNARGKDFSDRENSRARCAKGFVPTLQRQPEEAPAPWSRFTLRNIELGSAADHPP